MRGVRTLQSTVLMPGIGEDRIERDRVVRGAVAETAFTLYSRCRPACFTRRPPVKHGPRYRAVMLIGVFALDSAATPGNDLLYRRVSDRAVIASRFGSCRLIRAQPAG